MHIYVYIAHGSYVFFIANTQLFNPAILAGLAGSTESFGHAGALVLQPSMSHGLSLGLKLKQSGKLDKIP